MSKKSVKSSVAVRIYAVLAILAVILAVLFWRGTQGNFSSLSTRLDRSISEVLAKSGIDAGSIAEVTSREMKSGMSAWKEYSRQVRLSESIDSASLLQDIEQKARQYRLTVIRSDQQGGKISIKVMQGNHVLSHLLLEVTRPREESAAPVRPRKRFAMVIDDVGPTRSLSPLIDLGVPITFAIMPFERHSKEIAAELTARHMPFILHLPMEPLAYPKIDPGKAALLVKMSDTQIRAKFARDLSAVPGAVGVSNHMGSRFSEDEEKMKFLLGMVKAKDLFYFDSNTTPRTKAPKAARAVQLRFGENDLFVDLQDTPEFMRKQFDRILKNFKHGDTYIAIGHIHKKSLAPVLKEYIPKFKAEGIDFVPLTDMVCDQAKQ